MASKTLVLCEKSIIYNKFFPKGTYVEFDNEETIIDIINHYLDDGKALEKLLIKLRNLFMKITTGKHRIDKFKRELDLLILK